MLVKQPYPVWARDPGDRRHLRPTGHDHQDASRMAPTELPPFDLDAYLARIGVAGPLGPSAETLDRLHLAHATTIPFENLDLLLGRPIRKIGRAACRERV